MVNDQNQSGAFDKRVCYDLLRIFLVGAQKCIIVYTCNWKSLFEEINLILGTSEQLYICFKNEPVREKNQQFGFLTRSDTNQPVQSQKMVRGWKFWI